MKTGFALLLGAMLLLAFGCISSTPAAVSTGASSGFDPTTFRSTGVLSNNSTGNSIILGGALTTHAYSYTFGGNWSNGLGIGGGKGANITLQGSLDNATWAQLDSALANESGIAFVTGKPVVYARVLVLGWNASTNASISNLTVTYVGTKD